MNKDRTMGFIRKTFEGLVLISLLTGSAVAGSVYWYVDDEGVTHFAFSPEGSGSQSGQVEYQDIPDDSVVDNGNGTTTRVIDPAQFSGELRQHSDSSSHLKKHPDARPSGDKVIHEEDFEY